VKISKIGGKSKTFDLEGLLKYWETKWTILKLQSSPKNLGNWNPTWLAA
jgi:hypothetical protein